MSIVGNVRVTFSSRLKGVVISESVFYGAFTHLDFSTNISTKKNAALNRYSLIELAQVVSIDVVDPRTLT